MRSGVAYPSYDGSTMAMVSGAADADYPVANLADKQSIRTVFRAAAPGAIALTFVQPAARMLRFLGLLHHNAPAGATFRWRLFSDADPDPVGNAAHLIYDTGVQGFYPPGASPSGLYPQCTPHLLSGERAARSGRLDLSAHAAAWELGAIDLSGWWEWQDVAVPREFGIDAKDIVQPQIDGADHVMGQWSPRTIVGTRDVIDITEEQSTVMDFQFLNGKRRPFVWVWDYDDPATWPREVILVRNASVVPLNKQMHPTGRFGFNFKEHLR